MHSDHTFDDRPEHGPGSEATDCARAAEDAIRRPARLTVDRPSMTPADVDVVLAHLADAIAALPQVAAQLGDALDNANVDYRLTMDAMTGTVDPAIGIDTARLHLDGVREPAVDLYRRLDAAHNETAHISAAPRGHALGKIPPPRHDVRRLQPEPPRRPGTDDRRPGPAR